MATEIYGLLAVLAIAIAAAFLARSTKRRPPDNLKRRGHFEAQSPSPVLTMLSPSASTGQDSLALVQTQEDTIASASTHEQLCARLSAAGAQTELAPLLLARGQALLQSGNNRDGAQALRQAIEIAIENGMADIHALARLELAEISCIEGDLTTACEHWHMAKKLFEDQNRKESSIATDARMRSHGCPTEWVLTEF